MNQFLKIALYLIVTIGFSIARAGAYEDFFRAVGIDNDLTVGELLQRGFDPNSRDERGQTPLYLSMREGSPKVASLLLAHPGIRINLPNTAGETPLMMAAIKCRQDWAKVLIEKGAAVDALMQPGWSPLHYAASCDMPSTVIAQLIARGAKLEARSPNGTTPLMMAARYGHESAVDELLRLGSDRSVHNDLNLQAADFARQAGRDYLVQRLAAGGQSPR